MAFLPSVSLYHSEGLATNAFLIYYKVKTDNQTIDYFRITQLQPDQTDEHLLTPEVFIKFLVSLQEEHRKNCEKE